MHREVLSDVRVSALRAPLARGLEYTPETASYKNHKSLTDDYDWAFWIFFQVSLRATVSLNTGRSGVLVVSTQK